MTGIWEELKSRKIFKVATIYAAIAWGIIQISDILLPVLGIEEWVMSSMVLVAFAGFPAALIAGWMYDLRLSRRKLQTGEAPSDDNLVIRIIELAIIGMFGISAAYLYYNSASEPVKASNSQQSELTNILSDKADQKTIAVLPFANFSDSTEDEFFADGLSEELLNVLARNKKLRVAARTSSFQYKNTNINIRKIASELGVQFVLEGSIRRSGDLIRVTAQLINAEEDVHIFSKSWDRDSNNVFKVQDEIAQSVLNELKVSLLGESDNPNSELGTNNIAAFAEYSKGHAFLRNRGKSDFEQAIVHFKKALSIDPNYAEAMAMLAETYLLQVSYGLEKFEVASELSKPLIESALNINSELASAHAVKGLLHWQMAGHNEATENEDGKNYIDVAKKHLSKAIIINPSIAEAYMWYGSILQGEGNFLDGAELHKKAFEIDPQAAVAGFNRAQDLIRFGDYKGAMEVFNTVVRNNPNYPQAYYIAGNVSMQVGQLDQAYGMYQRLADVSGDQEEWLMQSSRIYIPLGEYEKAQAGISELKDGNLWQKYPSKIEQLQAYIWLATENFEALNNWTQSFDENTKKPNELGWRGFVALKQGKWQYAIEDIGFAIEQLKTMKPNKADEELIRFNLMLAKAYQESGDKLKAEQHQTEVARAISQLRSQGIVNQDIRYQEAALAALSEDHERANSLLGQAVQEGFVDFWWAEVDPSFDKSRKEAAYKIVREEFKTRMRLMRESIESQYGKFIVGV